MLTQAQIESRLSEGRSRKNWVPLLQVRADLIEQADGVVQEALRAGRGFTDDEHQQVSELLERAADIQREVSELRAAFEKAAPQAHLVGNQFPIS